MTSLVAIVPNSRPAFVAEPVSDENKVVEIVLEPVVAWKIVYESDPSNEFNDIATGIPITIHSGLTRDYAVYYGFIAVRVEHAGSRLMLWRKETWVDG